MYKALIITSSLLLSSTANASAQTQSNADVSTAPIGVSRQRVRVGTVPPEKRAEEMTSLLQGQLSLNPEETKQVYTVTLAYTQAIQANGLRYEREGMSAYQHEPQDTAELKTKYEAQLKAVLTPAQYERHLLIQERFRKLREQNGLK